jgi:hypothetical protein
MRVAVGGAPRHSPKFAMFVQAAEEKAGRENQEVAAVEE